MKTFRVKAEGITPLLQHRMTEESLFGLLGAKSKMKKDKVEKTPREIAEAHVYKAKTGELQIPTAYISGAFLNASSDFKQSNSSRKSLKSIAGGIFRPTDEYIPILDAKGKKVKDFEVDVRKATNHLKGAVAVCRPRFDTWSLDFTVELNDELIAPETAHHVLTEAGRRVGIGSFRVNKGGYFGQFLIKEWKEIK